MRHRAPEATRPALAEDGAGGPLRITGAYPPPLVPVRTAAGPDVVPVGRTRYDRRRHRAPRPRAARMWAGTSALLAAVGVASIVFVPQDGAPSARVDDVPVAVVAAPVPATGPARIAIPGLAAPTRSLQLPASEPVRVQIPALGVTSTVMDLGLRRDGSMEVPPGAYPVGWYDRSPTPGELGPAVLAGHVDWGGDRGVFYGLRELLPGDEVVVDRADGTVATFRVERVEEHGKDDFPSDEVYGDLDHAGLRLITCGGSFDADSGDYSDNVIVFARLVSTG